MLWMELTCADPAACLSALTGEGIEVWDVQWVSELKCLFRIRRQNYRLTEAVCKRKGAKLEISRRLGLYLILGRLWRRPVLVVGLTALLLLSLWVPGRVFFLQVEGNMTIPTEQILEAAQSCGLSFGVSCRQVRSEQVKNALLQAMPQLQWAGVNTYGCVGVITVRERNPQPQPEQISGISSIVALRDGVVGELTVTQGTALCKPGQAVQKGQVLISGYTDCGIYVRGQVAQGEVYAVTARPVELIFPTQRLQRAPEGEIHKTFTVIIGKKPIYFAKDSGISGTTCAKIERVYHLCLPGGFRLPVMLVVQSVVSYEIREAVAEGDLEGFAKSYLESQMVAGRVLDAVSTTAREEGLLRLQGVYSCWEMIGISRPEDLVHGKND